MTIDTQELRRLHGAATEGEWRVAGKKTIRAGDGWVGDTNWRNGQPNAAAIVALHNAAPALLDAADRLARIEAVLVGELAYVTVKECIVSNVPFVTDAHYAATAALAALRELIAAPAK